MLSKTLRKLSEQAIEALKQPDAEHLSRPVLVRRLRPVVQQFAYHAGEVSFVLEPRYIKRKEWSLTDQYRFINQDIKTLSSYTYCSEAMANSFNINREHLEPRLTRYLQVLLSSYLSDQDKSIVAPLSQMFLRDLAGEPVHWAIKGAIRGVAMDADQCRFGKYLLRRPVADDFEVEQGIEDVEPHPLHATPPSAVLEFETDAPDHHAVRQEYAGILNLLRLFRVGSIRSVALTSVPHSVIQTAGVLYSAGPAPTPYVYTMGRADQARLSRFLEHHLSCATRLETIRDTDNKHAIVCLAYKTYTLAVLGQGTAESHVLLALACLEALLLGAQERMGAGRAMLLAKRLGNLLRGCDARPEPVTSLLQQAYDIRIARCHLHQSNDAERQSLISLARSILNYARTTLIAFLRTPDRTSLEDIIEMLDGPSRSTQRLFRGTDRPL